MKKTAVFDRLDKPDGRAANQDPAVPRVLGKYIWNIVKNQLKRNFSIFRKVFFELIYVKMWLSLNSKGQ